MLISPGRLHTLHLGWVLVFPEAEELGEVVPNPRCKNIPGRMVLFGPFRKCC